MKQQFFIKQSHKNIIVSFIFLYLCFSIILTIGMIANQMFNWWFIVVLIAVLCILIYITKLFTSYGIYVINEKIYYKTLTRKEIDINDIVAIKIIKSEGQVNIAWPSFDLKDKNGNTLWSMMFLSEIKEEMREYPYGDIEFLNRYKKTSLCIQYMMRD